MRKEKKNLYPTPTGIGLIDLIHEELLKSAELTGIWEKRLRDIERANTSPPSSWKNSSRWSPPLYMMFLQIILQDFEYFLIFRIRNQEFWVLIV